MARVALSAAVVLMAVLVCGAQQTPSSSQAATSSPQTMAQAPSGVHASILVLLTKPLEAKKAKQGDPVVGKTVAELQGDGMTIPKGSKVIGHVTEAQARSKGAEQTSLGIAFDKVELPGGKEWPIQGVIQAVGPNPIPDVQTGAAGGLGMAGEKEQVGNGGTMPGPVGTVTDPEAMNPTPGHMGPLLKPTATGVVGIKHLELDKDGVLTTSEKNLTLEHGTQLLIRAPIEKAAAQ